jgi:catechol 2,3-dioxygenase-like lactoylglutathione lyase family enzyme
MASGSIIDYAIDHVQITVPRALEAETLRFYRQGLGLAEIPKPPELARNGGAWFLVGSVQVHVSIEEVDAAQNAASRRHLCYRVPDLAAAEARFRACGLTIIADTQPSAGWRRFYLRDPGGNRVEIAQRVL